MRFVVFSAVFFFGCAPDIDVGEDEWGSDTGSPFLGCDDDGAEAMRCAEPLLETE